MAFDCFCFEMDIKPTEVLLCDFHHLTCNNFDSHRVDLVARRFLAITHGYRNNSPSWRNEYFFICQSDLGGSSLKDEWKVVVMLVMTSHCQMKILFLITVCSKCFILVMSPFVICMMIGGRNLVISVVSSKVSLLVTC